MRSRVLLAAAHEAPTLGYLEDALTTESRAERAFTIRMTRDVSEPRFLCFLTSNVLPCTL